MFKVHWEIDFEAILLTTDKNQAKVPHVSRVEMEAEGPLQSSISFVYNRF